MRDKPTKRNKIKDSLLVPKLFYPDNAVSGKSAVQPELLSYPPPLKKAYYTLHDHRTILYRFTLQSVFILITLQVKQHRKQHLSTDSEGICFEPAVQRRKGVVGNEINHKHFLQTVAPPLQVSLSSWEHGTNQSGLLLRLITAVMFIKKNKFAFLVS